MALIPSDAFLPGIQKRMSSLCVPPINPEKCGLGGKSSGWVDLLQEASKVTVYSALASGSAVSASGDDSGSVVEDGDMEELQPTTPTAVIASVNH